MACVDDRAAGDVSAGDDEVFTEAVAQGERRFLQIPVDEDALVGVVGVEDVHRREVGIDITVWNADVPDLRVSRDDDRIAGFAYVSFHHERLNAAVGRDNIALEIAAYTLSRFEDRDVDFHSRQRSPLQHPPLRRTD